MRRAGNRVVPAARVPRGAWRGQYRVSRRAGAADQDGSRRTGLFLPLRIQHGFDAAGALRAHRAFRDNRIAAALDRERVGTRPARMHLCRAARARGRGVMVRVLGAPGDQATRLENRIGEPAANPYLFILSQIVAGLDGIEHGLDPGPPEDDPYNAKLPPLPTNLPAALDALEREPLFRGELGGVFVDYYLKLKRNEAGRFAQWLKETAGRESTEPTARDHNEDFDFF